MYAHQTFSNIQNGRLFECAVSIFSTLSLHVSGGESYQYMHKIQRRLQKSFLSKFYLEKIRVSHKNEHEKCSGVEAVGVSLPTSMKLKEIVSHEIVLVTVYKLHLTRLSTNI